MHNTANSIGEFVKEIAKSKNLKPSELGQRINTSKQNISDIYKRNTIDSELLLSLSRALDFNLFTFYNDKEPILSLRNAELLKWEATIEKLKEKAESLGKLLEVKEELLDTQKKYILELENKKMSKKP